MNLWKLRTEKEQNFENCQNIVQMQKRYVVSEKEREVGKNFLLKSTAILCHSIRIYLGLESPFSNLIIYESFNS